MNSYVWHLQGMMGSFSATSCSHWDVVLNVVATCLQCWANYTFQSILYDVSHFVYGLNNGLCILHGGNIDTLNIRRFLDQMSLEIIHGTLASHVTFTTNLIRNAHKICKNSKGWWSLKIKSQKCWISAILEIYVPSKFVHMGVYILQQQDHM